MTLIGVCQRQCETAAILISFFRRQEAGNKYHKPRLGVHVQKKKWLPCLKYWRLTTFRIFCALATVCLEGLSWDTVMQLRFCWELAAEDYFRFHQSGKQGMTVLCGNGLLLLALLAVFVEPLALHFVTHQVCYWIYK